MIYWTPKPYFLRIRFEVNGVPCRYSCQCSRSATLRYGSGTADQYYWITDRDSDSALFFSGFQDAKENFRFIILDTDISLQR
jgi:hypothetical protein